MDTEKIIAVARRLHSMLPPGYRMYTGAHENMMIDTPGGRQMSFQYCLNFVIEEGSQDIIGLDYNRIDESAEILLDYITT